MDDYTHRLDLDALTVYAVDQYGVPHDLNAQGEPCTTLADLREFVTALCRQGAYGTFTRDALLEQIAPTESR